MKANCSICSDLFDSVNTIIATPCGHVFHEICCYQWLEHSKTCPACRRKMTTKCMVKLYFTLGGDDVNETHDAESKLKNDLETAKADLKLKDMEKYKLLGDMDDLRKAVISAEDRAELEHQRLLDCQGQVTAARLQLKQLVKETSTLQNVSDENKRLLHQLNHLKNVQSIISDCQGDVNTTLSSWGGGSVNSEWAATYIVLLKRELQSNREARTKLANEVRTLKSDLGLRSSQIKELKQEIQELKAELDFLREALDAVETTNDQQKRTPESSKRKSSLLNKTLGETIPTPFKRPKMDMVSSVVSMVHRKPSTALPKAQNIIRVPQESLFRPQNSNTLDNESAISEGYNGLGGHTKFVSRSAPLKMKFTSVNKRPVQAKKANHPTLDRFIEL